MSSKTVPGPLPDEQERQPRRVPRGAIRDEPAPPRPRPVEPGGTPPPRRGARCDVGRDSLTCLLPADARRVAPREHPTLGRSDEEPLHQDHEDHEEEHPREETRPPRRSGTTSPAGTRRPDSRRTSRPGRPASTSSRTRPGRWRRGTARPRAPRCCGGSGGSIRRNDRLIDEQAPVHRFHAGGHVQGDPGERLERDHERRAPWADAEDDQRDHGVHEERDVREDVDEVVEERPRVSVAAHQQADRDADDERQRPSRHRLQEAASEVDEDRARDRRAPTSRPRTRPGEGRTYGSKTNAEKYAHTPMKLSAPRTE